VLVLFTAHAVGEFQEICYIGRMRGVVYEAHEVKKKHSSLLHRRKNKNIFFICIISLHGNFFIYALLYYYSCGCVKRPFC
jgi:hypothetical protein